MPASLSPFFIFNISFEFRDLFQPDFRRRANDDLKERVLSFEFIEEENAANKLVIRFDNSDLALFDYGFLTVGSAIVFDFGYSSSQDVFINRHGRRRHFITAIEGNEVLKLTALEDSFYAMNQEALTRTFINLTGTQIIEKIADEYGFARKIIRADMLGERKIVSRTTFQQIQDKQIRSFVFDQDSRLLVQGTFYQKAETDWKFLRRLAEAEDFKFYIQDEIFVFVPREDDERNDIKAFGFGPVYDVPKLTWNKENDENPIGLIKTFNLSHYIMGAPLEAKACGIAPLTKKEFASLSSVEQTERFIAGPESTIVNQDSVDLQKLKPNKIIPRAVFPIAGNSALDAISTTDAYLKRNESNALTLRVKIIGNPGARTNSFIRIDGLGIRYSGVWHAFKVKHKYDFNGFNTSIEFDKSGLEGPIIPPRAKITKQEILGPERRFAERRLRALKGSPGFGVGGF